MTAARAAPPYRRVKAYLLARIRDGVWREGDRVPSEHELARRFRVARMTAHRALRELAAEQVLTRAQGAGTFVAAPRHESTLVAVRPIAAEIRARGGEHRGEVLRLGEVAATPALAAELRVRPGARLYASRLVHRQDGVPVQYEERWVVPALAPGYLEQDFTRSTPSEYLLRVAPLARVEYRVEARRAPPAVRRALGVGAAEPFLLLHRRTFSRGRPAAVAELWHPGSRFVLTGHA